MELNELIDLAQKYNGAVVFGTDDDGNREVSVFYDDKNGKEVSIVRTMTDDGKIDLSQKDFEQEHQGEEIKTGDPVLAKIEEDLAEEGYRIQRGGETLELDPQRVSAELQVKDMAKMKYGYEEDEILIFPISLIDSDDTVGLYVTDLDGNNINKPKQKQEVVQHKFDEMTDMDELRLGYGSATESDFEDLDAWIDSVDSHYDDEGNEVFEPTNLDEFFAVTLYDWTETDDSASLIYLGDTFSKAYGEDAMSTLYHQFTMLVTERVALPTPFLKAVNKKFKYVISALANLDNWEVVWEMVEELAQAGISKMQSPNSERGVEQFTELVSDGEGFMECFSIVLQEVGLIAVLNNMDEPQRYIEGGNNLPLDVTIKTQGGVSQAVQSTLAQHLFDVSGGLCALYRVLARFEAVVNGERYRVDKKMVEANFTPDLIHEVAPIVKVFAVSGIHESGYATTKLYDQVFEQQLNDENIASTIEKVKDNEEVEVEASPEASEFQKDYRYVVELYEDCRNKLVRDATTSLKELEALADTGAETQYADSERMATELLGCSLVRLESSIILGENPSSTITDLDDLAKAVKHLVVYEHARAMVGRLFNMETFVKNLNVPLDDFVDVSVDTCNRQFDHVDAHLDGLPYGGVQEFLTVKRNEVLSLYAEWSEHYDSEDHLAVTHLLIAGALSLGDAIVKTNEVIDATRRPTLEQAIAEDTEFLELQEKQDAQAVQRMYEAGRMQAELAIVTAYKNKESLKSIREAYNIQSNGALYSILHKHGVEPQKSDKVAKRVSHITENDALLKQVLDAYANGMKLADIYKRFDLYKNGLYYLLDLYNVPRRQRG